MLHYKYMCPIKDHLHYLPCIFNVSKDYNLIFDFLLGSKGFLKTKGHIHYTYTQQ